MPKNIWHDRHWLVKGMTVTFALLPACLFAQWPHVIMFIGRMGLKVAIAVEIAMYLVLIIIAIQGVMGAVFIHSTTRFGKRDKQ